MLKWEITPTTPTPSWKKCKRLVTSPRMPSQEPCCARSYHQAVLLWPCTLLSSMESFCPLCWVSSALQSLTTFQEEDQLFSFDLSHPTGVGPALVSSRVWCPFHQVSVPQLNWPQLMNVPQACRTPHTLGLCTCLSLCLECCLLPPPPFLRLTQRT